MKSLQDNYNLIKEGKGSKELFLKQVRREFPQYISNVNTFNQVTANLKTRGIISETLSSDLTSKNTEPNWFNIFKENINEAKATEKKTSKEVKDLEEKNFDYKDTANADNLIGAEILTGFYAEMKDPKNLEKTVEEVRAIVIKNLSKDALYYVKDGQFGVKGLGYTEAEQKEAKGKYKASGYGDITEGIVKEEKESLVTEGQYSWMTHDSNTQIGSEKENTINVTMFDDKGNKWEEKRYDGYGEFGGMDYYELLAQMNGIENADRGDGIDIKFGKKKVKGKVLFPALVEDPRRFNFKKHDFTKEAESDPNQSWYQEEEYDESVVTEDTIEETSINENQVEIITKKWPYVKFKDGETVHKVEFEYGDMVDDHGSEGQDQYWVGEDENGQEFELDVYADYQGNVQDVHYDTITRV